MDKQKEIRQAFERNNFGFTYLENKHELPALLDGMMKSGSVVSVGGSMTLFETGVIDYLRSGRFDFLDRYAENADTKKIYRESFFADYYLASANALTMHGEVYMVDGTGNRVAATIYGPDKVFLICGTNKIVTDLNEAVYRVESTAAPLNAKRLRLKTFCNENGRCAQNGLDERNLMCGFRCSETICCSTAVLSRQKVKERIHIILIEGNFGY